MNINEIVGRLKAGGLDASSTNRGASVYVTEARSGRAEPGWFGFRIICDSEATERRVRAILSRWYDIDASGNVWRLRAKNRVPLLAIKRGGVPPTPPTPTGDYMYFEAMQANSTVSMMSTLATAPNLEYSTDGETWQEWQHTTVTEDEMTTHTFDTLTLTAVGDRVYLRGDNPNGLANMEQMGFCNFTMTGKLNSGGNLMSLLDKYAELTVIPPYGFAVLFGDLSGGNNPNTALLSTPDMSTVTSIGDGGLMSSFAYCTALTAVSSMPSLISIGYSGFGSTFSGCTSLAEAADMPSLVTIGELCFSFTYSDCTSLAKAADMPSLANIGKNGCESIYLYCTFDMSDDGTTLNFDFPIPPITTTGDDPQTYATAYDIAQWMGNTNGFTTP